MPDPDQTLADLTATLRAQLYGSDAAADWSGRSVLPTDHLENAQTPGGRKVVVCVP